MKSSGVVSFTLSALALERRDRMAGPFDQRGIVGEIGAARRSRPCDAPRAEAQTRRPAGSARCAERRGRRSRRYGRRPNGLDRVGETQRRNSGAGGCAASIARAIRAGDAKGRAASWISTWVGRLRLQRRQARQAPRPAGSRRRTPEEGGQILARRPGKARCRPDG